MTKQPEKKMDAESLNEAVAKMKKPELVFEFPKDAGRAPLKMSYGLEMDLRRMLPDPQIAISLLLSDPYTQDYVVRRCLTDTKKIITKPDEELIPAEEVDLDGDTIEALLMWAAEHAIYFFAKRTAGIATLGVPFQSLMTAQPQPSSSGSEALASKMPSAGDSES